MAYPPSIERYIVGQRCRHCGERITAGRVYGLWVTVNRYDEAHPGPNASVMTLCPGDSCAEFKPWRLDPDRVELMQIVGEMFRRSYLPLHEHDPDQYFHQEQRKPRRPPREAVVPSITPVPLSPIEAWEVERFTPLLDALRHPVRSKELKAFMKRIRGGKR